MRIVVRNNDPMKAFKLLNRKLYEDNTFVDLKDKQFFKSNFKFKKFLTLLDNDRSFNVQIENWKMKNADMFTTYNKK